MSDNDNKANGSEQAIPEKLFAPRKVYLKDVSFEAPSSPEVFTHAELDLINDVKLTINHKTLDEKLGLYEVELKVTVTAKHDEEFVYLAEVQQAGVFQINHPQPEALNVAREINAPHVLLPFVREELNSLITKGGFSSFLLTAINFETAYTNKQVGDEEPAADAKAEPKS